MRFLLIEDDLQMAGYLVKALAEAGHVADHAATGRDGLFLASSETYDALIVDRLLPLMDGLAVIGVLRATGRQTPVMILSALDDVDERIRGLRAGGDDYLVKPFVFRELLARLEAIVRRAQPNSQGAVTVTRLRVSNLELDPLSRQVRRAGQLIDLKPQEFRLLEFLMRHAGQVVTRTMILESVWDYHFDPQTNVIDVHVSRLRAKIDRDHAKPLIHTVRGAGYCLREPEAVADIL
ncbi:winged helix-turn-helix domain-containing protein [Nevskia sp.]|uniref:winged helix-turn-helix domain-containing protein n=1 Tax=Nevskia sp. TaxID=1929292 RepID=UPI003F702D70